MQEDENKGVVGGATGEVVENKGVSLQRTLQRWDV
jgi:hypothetical protein